MIEIKEGIDLDRAVAEAIGQSFATDAPEGFVGIWDNWGPDLPKYSTGLNDAFHAAEVTGLFNVVRDGPEVHLAKTIDGQWEILTGGSEMGYISREATPVLAICAAILNMEPLKRT